MIRVMTYNIRACRGADKACAPDRIAGVIAAADPHVVALQEVDFERQRTGALDQAHAIATALGMLFAAGPSFHDSSGGSYGNAILSRLPFALVRHGELPYREGAEPRSVMWVRVDTDDGPLDLINTHLHYRRPDRLLQAEALVSEHWLASDELGPHAALVGDLNAVPRDPAYKLLRTRLDDALADAPERTRRTWPAKIPMRRIDHVLTTPALRAARADVVRDAITKIASDHLPVVVDLERTDAR